MHRVLRLALLAAVIGFIPAWGVYVEPDNPSFGDHVLTAFAIGLVAAMANTLSYRWLRVVASQEPAMPAPDASEPTAKLWVANFAILVASFTVGFSLFALSGLWLPVSLAIFAAGFLGSRRIHQRIDSRRATYSPEPAP